MSTTVFGQGTGDNAFDPVESLNYEQARDELIEVVRILELGQMGLDESLKYWERGEALAKRCEEHLAGAARRVEAALQSTDGHTGTEAAGNAAGSATGNTVGGTETTGDMGASGSGETKNNEVGYDHGYGQGYGEPSPHGTR